MLFPHYPCVTLGIHSPTDSTPHPPQLCAINTVLLGELRCLNFAICLGAKHVDGLEPVTLYSVPSPKLMVSCRAHSRSSMDIHYCPHAGEGDRLKATRACLPIQFSLLTGASLASRLPSLPSLSSPPFFPPQAPLHVMAPSMPPLDSRQPHFWKRANRAESWRGQMAGATGGGMEAGQHITHATGLLLKKKKTSRFFPSNVPSLTWFQRVLIIFTFTVVIKSARTHFNQRGIVLPAGTAQQSYSLSFRHDGGRVASILPSGRGCQGRGGFAVACIVLSSSCGFTFLFLCWGLLVGRVERPLNTSFRKITLRRAPRIITRVLS